MNHYRSRLGTALATATLLGLSACGGGSDSPVAATTTTFSGTAATGKAMASAAIDITCASGAGSVGADIHGVYSKDIINVTLPCALRATSSDGTVLYSVTSATATSNHTQTANITPLTQLLVASLTGMDPASFYNSVSTTPANLTSTVTDNTIGNATTAVLAILGNAGITAVPSDLISGSLVAGSSTNVYDAALEAWKTAQTNNGTSDLPANLVLKTAASNCPTLRSTDYLVAAPTPGGNLADQFDSFSLNASTLVTKNSDNSTSTLVASSDTCHYTASDLEMVVSPAGVILGRTLENGIYRMRLAIPKQTIAVSELAGTWNALSFEKNSAGTLHAGHAVTGTIGSTGVFSNVSFCDSASPTATCTAPTTTITVSSNSAGGFNVVGSGTDNWTNRAFAYRAGNGSLMMLSVSGDGSQSIWTKQRTLSLPTAATVFGKSWSIYTNSSAVASILNTSNTSTVTSSDAAANNYIRTVNLANGSVDYSETIVINSPRNGFNFRAAGTTTAASDGRSVSLRERTSLGLHGMGVSVQSVPIQSGITAERFQISVDQP